MLKTIPFGGINRKLLLFITLFFSLNLFAAQHQPGAEAFQKGNQAYREGNYEAALEYYESAREQGRKTPTLTYNLGVTHYILQQYEESEAYFEALAGTDPEWQDIAHYNLGLIAMKTGDEAKAEDEFKLVLQISDNEQLRYLAGQALDKLDVHIDVINSSRVKDWLLLMSLSGGYDDNAVAFPDLQTSLASSGSDEFLELLVYGQNHVLGDHRNGLRLHGLAFTKQYKDLDVVDVSTFSGGITNIHSYDSFQLEYGLGAGYNEVNSNKLSSQLQGMLQFERDFGNNEYTFTYRPAYHDGGGNYAYLDGWQHKMDLRFLHREEAWRLTSRYGFELNDREDLAEGNSFSSFSPTRHSFLLQGDWYLARDWTLTAGGEYVKSDYKDENRLLDLDGQFKVQSRDSDLYGLWLKAQYDLTTRWRILGEYEYNNKNDNFLLYDYERNEFKLSVEFSY
jgi:prepilin-type processing-associated H-X9-DG protein